MNPCALVINSHSSNQDCLKIFFSQLEKFFDHKIFSNVYLFVDKLDRGFETPEYVTIVPYEANDCFTDQMIDCLSMVKEEIILYTNEDYLLYDYPQVECIKTIFCELTEQTDLSYIRFVYADIDSFATYTEIDGNDLLYIPPTSQSCFSQTLSLWKTSDYLRIHKEGPKASIRGNTQGHFESLVKQTCKDLNIRGCVVYSGEKKRGLFHYDSNLIPHTASALVKGKWNLSEYPELSNMLSDNKIDCSIRGSV